MNRLMWFIAAICAIPPFAASARAQNTYTFTSFDIPFANASNTRAFDINARGDIVGRFFDSSMNGIPRGFHRYNDGTYALPIDAPVPNTGTVARGINSRGDIAGKFFDPKYPNEAHGFLLTAAGAFSGFDVNLPDVIAGQFGSTVANGINNLGTVVGEYTAFAAVPGCVGIFGLPRGFLRNANGTYTEISFPGAIATIPAGIDDAGNIVGTYITVPNPPSACNASALATANGFVRDAKGNYSTVDPPGSAGALETVVTRISDAGDIIGVYATVQTTLGQILGDSSIPAGVAGTYFVLSADGTFNAVPSPFAVPGQQAPLGINPRSTLVGFYTDANGDHGFIATR